MYANIKRVTETCDVNEVNRLLSEGWKLLDIRPAKFSSYQKHDYLMGETGADAVQRTVDEINRRTKETPRSPIVPAVVEPLKPKVTTVRVDDGTREVKFQNQSGEEIGSFRFRPADLGIIDRYKKVAELWPILGKAFDELSTDSGEENYRRTKATLCQLFDFMFDGPVSKGIFKKIDPFNIVGDDGKFFCEVVLDAIANLIDSEFTENLKRRREYEKKLVKNPKVDLEKRVNVILSKYERLLDVLTESLLPDATMGHEGGASE